MLAWWLDFLNTTYIPIDTIYLYGLHHWIILPYIGKWEEKNRIVIIIIIIIIELLAFYFSLFLKLPLLLI